VSLATDFGRLAPVVGPPPEPGGHVNTCALLVSFIGRTDAGPSHWSRYGANPQLIPGPQIPSPHAE